MEEKNILILYKDKSKFYKVTDKDACVLSYLLDYKIINDKVGFPDNAIDKVIEILDRENISYEIIYTDKNPVIKTFQNNRYDEVYDNWYKDKSINDRIDSIFDKIKQLDCDKINNILDRIDNILMEG